VGRGHVAAATALVVAGALLILLAPSGRDPIARTAAQPVPPLGFRQVVLAVAAPTGSASPTPSLEPALDVLHNPGDHGPRMTTPIRATIRRLSRLGIKRYRGALVERGAYDTGMVAITFDDGPSENTVPILKELTATGSRATFFLIGARVESAPERALAILAQGSEIGDHTYSHVRLTRMNPESFAAEVDPAQDAIFAATGWRPTLLRPKGGWIEDRAVQMAAGEGLVVVDWDVHSGDTAADATVGSIVSHATSGGSGSIVLMHEKRRETVEALPRIIERLQRRGLKLVTVSELLAASASKP
jgi:peptidoglycan-N-acetylglucosamine deacetylase